MNKISGMTLKFFLIVVVFQALPGCGGAGGEGSPADLDKGLEKIIHEQGLTGNPLPDGLNIDPSGKEGLIKLGQLLFFSKTMGGTFDSACASCHHPDFFGGDSLSLPIGVSAKSPNVLGPGRDLNIANDFDPQKDGGPNVPRNSQTILNAALYRSAVFFDGRVFLLGEVDGIRRISTPDSSSAISDPMSGETLLEAQARFPITSPDEMRNFFHPELSTPEDFRDFLIKRLKGEEDVGKLRPEGPQRWLDLFRSAFKTPSASADEVINYKNVQRAIAAYETDLTFIDTPWRDYVNGSNRLALDSEQKSGAILFFSGRNAGGLGCSACHSGDFFTGEGFFNVGFPQIGRGKRADGRDFGRWQVTKQESDKFSFRVPSLINVALSAPYGHAGSFQTLDEVIRYHANPVSQIEEFDFSGRHLAQFSGGEAGLLYANARTYTLEALGASSYASAMLPNRNLTDKEVSQVKAFLLALTDKCLIETSCRARRMSPPSADEDPDGNLLTRLAAGQPDPGIGNAGTDAGGTPSTAPGSYAATGVLLARSPRSGFPDLSSCPSEVSNTINDGTHFVERASQLGLSLSHGFSVNTWLNNSLLEFLDTMFAGGVSVSYLDGDCWPDIIFSGGDAAGVRIYSNRLSTGSGFEMMDILPPEIGTRYTGSAIVDFDGDYRREIVLGNLLSGTLDVLQLSALGNYEVVAKLPMSRNTFGMAFGDYDGDGYPDMYLAHWDVTGLPGTAPAFWRNDAGSVLRPSDGSAGTSAAADNNQNWQFSPSFVDIDQDGRQDLLIASDFGSSTIFRNVKKPAGGYAFSSVTDTRVINDENGMGSALGDYDNDGDLDWFVSAIQDPNGVVNRNWGITGNRLYRNDSAPGDVRFANVSMAAGVRNGLWGWGSCFADFNNDGWLDIFEVNGTGYIPISSADPAENIALQAYRVLVSAFTTKPPQLLINNKNGTFSEAAGTWGLTAGVDGRGLACFDYDRDGDIDVLVLDHSKQLKFYENRNGSGTGGYFLSVRLQGKRPNTEALGAKVYVTADLNGDGIVDSHETQIRVSAANSNYNSQNPPDLHFGLGKAGGVEQVRIVWPDGSEQLLGAQDANRFIVAIQP